MEQNNIKDSTFTKQHLQNQINTLIKEDLKTSYFNFLTKMKEVFESQEQRTFYTHTFFKNYNYVSYTKSDFEDNFPVFKDYAINQIFELLEIDLEKFCELGQSLVKSQHLDFLTPYNVFQYYIYSQRDQIIEKYLNYSNYEVLKHQHHNKCSQSLWNCDAQKLVTDLTKFGKEYLHLEDSSTYLILEKPKVTLTDKKVASPFGFYHNLFQTIYDEKESYKTLLEEIKENQSRKYKLKEILNSVSYNLYQYYKEVEDRKVLYEDLKVLQENEKYIKQLLNKTKLKEDSFTHKINIYLKQIFIGLIEVNYFDLQTEKEEYIEGISVPITYNRNCIIDYKSFQGLINKVFVSLIYQKSKASVGVSESLTVKGYLLLMELVDNYMMDWKVKMGTVTE